MNSNRAVIAVIGLLLIAGNTAVAQTWPGRPVKIIIPGTPGNGADLAGRVIAQKLQERLGQPFVVDNRPGAGSIIGSELAKNAPPDGYT